MAQVAGRPAWVVPKLTGSRYRSPEELISVTGQGARQEVVLIADRCWDGRSDHPAGRTEVAVSDGRITQTGSQVDRGSADVVELGDRTLMPGLIDCHVHTTVNPSRLLDAAVSDPATVMAFDALPVLRTLLDQGFTTVRDLATFAPEPITLYLRDAIADGLITGPRMIVAPYLISARGAHGDISTLLGPQLDHEMGALADGPAAIVRTVREHVRAGADWIKFGATGGFGTPTDDPGQTTYMQEEMEALVAAARDLEVPCTPHAYGDEGVERAVRAGTRSIEHGNLATARTLSLMERQGVYLVPTQFMVIDALNHLDDDSYWQGKDPAEREKFDRYADRLRESTRNVAASEVKIAFGTDAGMFPHDQNWREFPTMVDTGITPLRALRAATSVAADLLKRPDLGRIERGATADLIAVPGNPFDDIAVTGRVDFVMRDGRLHRSVPLERSA